MQFGARGDGVADDTQALQRALDEGDGDFRLSPGNYRITRPLEVRLTRGRTSVSGSGGTARLLMAGAGPALRITGTHRGTADPKDTAGDVGARQRLPQVSDLEIVGEHPEADAIEVAYALQPTFTRLLLRHCRHGIHIVENNRNVLISDCHIYDNAGAGVFLDGVNLHQINISGSHISYNRSGGIKVWGSEIRNLQICGNDIEYNFDQDAPASADIWIETRGHSVREGAITGNTIQALPSPGGANIRFIGESAAVGHKVGLFSIAGNLISSQETNIHLRWARGVTLAGNTLFSGNAHSIHAEECTHLALGSNGFEHNPDYRGVPRDTLLFEDCAGCTLSGLNLSDILGGEADDGACIEFRRCRGVAVTGCLIANPARRGILLADCEDACVGHCVVTDDRPQSRPGEPVRVAGGRRIRVDAG